MDYSKMKSVDKSLPIKDRISFLKECAKKYEAGCPLISDKEYDEEYYYLNSISDDEFFDAVGGEIDKDHIYGDIVSHKIIMGSLSKSLSISEFEIWLNNTFDKNDILQFLFMHKLDGLSLSLVYSNRKLIQALTRGDGEKGVDVYKNCLEISDIPKTISYDGEVEFRGEVIKDKAGFKKWKDLGYANERNFAAGSLNQKDARITRERELSFIAYEVLRKDDFNYQQEKTEYLEANGFKTLKSSSKVTKAGLTFKQIALAADIYMNKDINRNSLPYLIDGIVVKLTDIKKSKKMGSISGGRKSKSDRAIKYKSETAETTIMGIEVDVGRSGKLCPVAILKEVELGGSKITKATLHNFGTLIGKDAIKIGAKVEIARKSDIIPQIIRIIEGSGIDFPIPSKCPSCGEIVIWSENDKGEKVDLICENTDCLSQLNKKIEFYLKTIGVKDIGQGLLTKLTDKNILSWENKPIISSLEEIYYKLDNDRKVAHPFQKYQYLKDQLGEKTYENLLKNIHSVKEATLPIFVESLGFKRIGSMSKLICDIYPTVEDLDKVTVDDLMKIDKFGPEKAKSFVNSWKARRDEIRRLLKYITIKQVVKSSDKMKGMKFCFTGSFSQGRDELQQIVIDNGGKASSSVGKDVILVWDGSITGGKYDKAVKDRNKIISEADFFKMLD